MMAKGIAADDDAQMVADLASGAMQHDYSPVADNRLIAATRAAIARSKKLLERAPPSARGFTMRRKLRL